MKGAIQENKAGKNIWLGLSFEGGKWQGGGFPTRRQGCVLRAFRIVHRCSGWNLKDCVVPLASARWRCASFLFFGAVRPFMDKRVRLDVTFDLWGKWEFVLFCWKILYCHSESRDQRRMNAVPSGPTRPIQRRCVLLRSTEDGSKQFKMSTSVSGWSTLAKALWMRTRPAARWSWPGGGPWATALLLPPAGPPAPRDATPCPTARAWASAWTTAS